MAARFDVLAVHEALGELARLDKRQAHIVELRFFEGLTLATARLWLRRRMRSA